MSDKGARDIDPMLIRGRMGLLAAAREYLDQQGYVEVQTPVLQPRLSGFEKATGFSTFSASLGERLWFRAAPEMYLKRLIIDLFDHGIDKVFEMAICLRDEFDESVPQNSFDRPELTLLELYGTEPDPWALEPVLRGLIDNGIARLEKDGLVPERARQGLAALQEPWERRGFSDLLSAIDPDFDLDGLLGDAAPPEGAALGRAEVQAGAIEARASDARLRDAAASLAFKAGDLGRYLKVGPQGYWYDFVEHAFAVKVAPTLVRPVIVHRLPLESSPLADSSDGIHGEKWELYVNGVRVALAERELVDPEAQKVRFQHLDRLRRLGYDLLPEPDESFLDHLERWPSGRSLTGLGVYMDRLAGTVLGAFGAGGSGQELMVPNLFKPGT